MTVQEVEKLILQQAPCAIHPIKTLLENVSTGYVTYKGKRVRTAK